MWRHNYYKENEDVAIYYIIYGINYLIYSLHFLKHSEFGWENFFYLIPFILALFVIFLRLFYFHFAVVIYK